MCNHQDDRILQLANQTKQTSKKIKPRYRIVGPLTLSQQQLDWVNALMATNEVRQQLQGLTSEGVQGVKETLAFFYPAFHDKEVKDIANCIHNIVSQNE